MAEAPCIVLIGGPNGAGKTTVSREVLAEQLGVTEFVNADFIARGLSGFRPEASAIAAGRIMLARLNELATARTSFAFESTLASRTFAPWLEELVRSGYELIIVFVWLNSPDLAIQRVRRRVREGGHHIPADVVRRRYRRCITNFVHLYLPLAARWKVYDNSAFRRPQLVAFRRLHGEPTVVSPSAWAHIQEIASDQTLEDDR